MSAATTTDTPGKSRVGEQLDDEKPVKVDTLGEALSIFVRNTSPRILMVTLTLAWTLKIAAMSWSWWDLAVAAAIFAFWPVQEWLIHVFILHFRPRVVWGKKIDLYVAHKHRVHHRNPWILEHTWIPPKTLIFALPIVIPLYLLGAYTVMDTGIALAGFAVYFTFATIYEWTHFLVHVSYKPKSAAYRKVWKSHRLHHFKNEHYWYGVSRLGGDKLLGTQPDPKTVEKSATCRDLDAGFAGVEV